MCSMRIKCLTLRVLARFVSEVHHYLEPLNIFPNIWGLSQAVRVVASTVL